MICYQLGNSVILTDQLSRLHMILKPFMLRRVKKDVENELSDKVCSSFSLMCFYVYRKCFVLSWYGLRGSHAP